MFIREIVIRGALLSFVAQSVATLGWAGTWLTPVVLGTNAFYGSIALDSAGNMTSVWFQSQLANGTAVDQIWASSARFGLPWSAPVDISGTISVSGGSPVVSSSASGNVTAVYTGTTATGNFVDHPAGGSWGKPGSTNGINQFYVSNEKGDEGLAWGTGGARAASSTVQAVERPAGSNWSSAATIATGAHLAFDGAVMTPNGSMAVAWESYASVCGERTCKTSNWVLHVSIRAAGTTNWVDSGALLGPDSSQHFGQLAADGLGDLAVVCLHSGNVVSLVSHGGSWNTTPAVIASNSTVGFYTGTGRDNRIFKSDLAGHATYVDWSNPYLISLVAIDGNLTTNTWGKVTTISGSDQFPNYFDFAMSQSGTAIVFWSITPAGSNTTWRAATRSGPTTAWNAPSTAGTSNEGEGVPESVAINEAGQAAVVFHGYSADFTTYILYTNEYQP